MTSLHIVSQTHPEAGEIKHDPVCFTSWFWWIWSPSVSFIKIKVHIFALDSSSVTGQTRKTFLALRFYHLITEMKRLKSSCFPLQHCLWMWHSSVCLFLSFILAFVLWVTDRIWININDFAIRHESLSLLLTCLQEHLVGGVVSISSFKKDQCNPE